MYPVAVTFQLPGEDKPRQGAITFLTADRKHDFFQVAVSVNRSLACTKVYDEIIHQVFEAKIFSYLKEKFGIEPQVWHR